jgi:endonuclease YncB( thermonuclease family)
MIRRFAAALALVCFFSVSLARADEVVVPDKIISGDEIALQDGRILRLAGIKAAAPETKQFLESIVPGHALIVQNATTDRYGRTTAIVSIQGAAQPLEDNLLSRGLAFVYPAATDEQLDHWCALERAARKDKLGFWSGQTDVAAEDAKTLVGKYGFVSGTVVKAERVKNKVYLDFGADWRSDFAIIIAAHDLRVFKKQGVDPLDLQGKKLRIRGWVTRTSGPRITVTDSHQLELLP